MVNITPHSADAPRVGCNYAWGMKPATPLAGSMERRSDNVTGMIVDGTPGGDMYRHLIPVTWRH